MEEIKAERKTEEELKQEMYQEQWISFMAEMCIKYAAQMQPVFEAEDAKLRKQGSSLKKEWEKVSERYYRAMNGAMEAPER